MPDEVVQIRFDGGLASRGQLDFYEFSRSQYGLARFVATVEHFRRTGEVAARITRGNYVELSITAPQRGSFIQDILVQTVSGTAAGVATAGFLATLAYVWHLLSPRRERTDDAVQEAAQLRLAVEREKTAQARERTQQFQIWRNVAEGERATAAQALDLIRWSLDLPADIESTLESSEDERRDMLREIEAEQEREEEFESSKGALREIDEEALNALTSRLRPMVSEIALPLRKSASRMSVGSNVPHRKQLLHITPAIVDMIQSRSTERKHTTLVGRIKAYDRDAGVGKIQSEELPRVLTFLVPPDRRLEMRDDILAAMKYNLVTIVCRRVVDESGLPTSLILISVQIPQADEEE
jgi:hypothetical protein